METNKLQWKRIAKGDRLPCDSLLMKKNGTIKSMVSGAGVKVGQDAYYLSVEELKSFPKEESENEKTKRLLHTIAYKIGQHLRDIFTEEEYQCYDAWSNACLEKQSEPTEINPSEFDSQLNSLLKKFKSLPKEELASSLSFYLNVVQNDGTYKEEKQGEQKGTLCDTCRKAQPSHSCQDITALGRCALEKQGELMPAEWSGEDENISSAIIKRLSGSDALSVGLQSAICWVENVKYRVQHQPTWKPSDEQMKALGVATNISNVPEKEYLELEKLYQDLKKLMEE